MKVRNSIGLLGLVSLLLLLNVGHVPAVPVPSEMEMKWSTYLGGSAEDSIRSLDRDSEGNIAVLGYTQSNNFPVSDGALQTTYGGSQDCFVALFDNMGQVKFVTYLGGTGSEYSSAIAFDSTGNLSVIGMTGSSDFPLLNPYQDTMEGDTDIFITKFYQTGDLIFSTFLGGDGSDWGYGLVYDSQDNLVFTGHIDSTDFPITSDALQPSYGGGEESIVVKLSSDGQSLLYSSYLGGSSNDLGLCAAVDADDNIAIGGIAGSSNFPILNAFQENNGGALDSFITYVNGTDGSLIFSSFIGGENDDGFWGIDFNSQGDIVAVGRTFSPDLNTTDNAPQKEHGGLADVMITQFTNNGELIMSTYFGSSNQDHGWDLELDDEDNILVTGYTYSEDYHIVNMYQDERAGYQDAFFTLISGANYTTLFSSYLGGDGSDSAYAITMTHEDIVIAGFSSSDNFFNVSSYQNERAGSRDAFIAVLQNQESSEPSIPTPDTINVEMLAIAGAVALVIVVAIVIIRKNTSEVLAN